MKKGFTLIELLAVIVIIGVVATLVLPGLVQNYEKSIDKAMQIQESEIADGVGTALTDYCNNPINKEAKKNCLATTENPNGLIKEYNGKYYICLSKVNELGYYDNKVEYEKQECQTFITVQKNDDGKYVSPKAYIYCGNDYDYDYATDETLEDFGKYLEGCGYE